MSKDTKEAGAAPLKPKKSQSRTAAIRCWIALDWS